MTEYSKNGVSWPAYRLLAPGHLFLVLIAYADFVVLALWVKKKHLIVECPHLQSIRDRSPGLFRVSTMIQFL
jgi:hypothetical protein